MELGKNIVKLRKQNNIKAKHLAESIGIDQSYLSQIENGKRSPSLDVVRKIAHALDTTVSELLGETPLQLSVDMKRLVEASKYLSPNQVDIVINVVKEIGGKYGS
ncbi:MAG: helix-turn-helix domain-containing protein [Acetivibrionales bacterium]|jgi:transcriptional regulator with XRE-family HTH domain